MLQKLTHTKSRHTFKNLELRGSQVSWCSSLNKSYDSKRYDSFCCWVTQLIRVKQKFPIIMPLAKGVPAKIRRQNQSRLGQESDTVHPTSDSLAEWSNWKYPGRIYTWVLYFPWLWWINLGSQNIPDFSWVDLRFTCCLTGQKKKCN